MLFIIMQKVVPLMSKQVYMYSTYHEFIKSRGGGKGVLSSNRLMGMCGWMGSHFYDWIDYNGVAFSIGANRVTRIGLRICRISGISKFQQVGIWGIFAQK